MKVTGPTGKLVCFSFSLFAFFLIGSIYANPKVKVSLYYESLCPYSARYISEQLYPIYRWLGRRIELDYVPFGNAEMMYHPFNSSYTFNCQHGPDECKGNKIQGCLKHLFNDTDHDATLTQLQVVNCLMSGGAANLGQLAYCIKNIIPVNVGLTYQKIVDCALGIEGDKILAEMGNTTMALKPQHEWVPWVTVDGEHQPGAEKNLGEFLCKGKLMNVSECQRKSMKGESLIRENAVPFDNYY